MTNQLLLEGKFYKAWLEACDLLFSNVTIILCFVTSDFDCKDRLDMSLKADPLLNPTLVVEEPPDGLIGEVSAQ